MKKIKVVLFSHFFAVTAASEYFVRALKRRSDVELKTVGSYHGLDMSVWGNGISNMPNDYDFKPDICLPPLPIGDSNIPVQMVENLLGGFQPDLWLTVDSGIRMVGKPKNGINTVFYTDPHTGLVEFYRRTQEQYDYRFNPQRQYVVSDNEYYIPYGADKEWNAPLENVEKIYDCVLLGNYYPQRIELRDRLNGLGYKTLLKLGVAKKDAQIVHNQSKICLNLTSMKDLNARVFETMGCKVPLLTNRLEDLDNLFVENEHYFGYSTIDESIDKVKWILENYDKALIVAENGYDEVHRLHLWDNRVQTIFDLIGVNSEH